MRIARPCEFHDRWSCKSTLAAQRSARSNSATCRSCGVVTLKFARRGLDHAHGPAGALDQRRRRRWRAASTSRLDVQRGLERLAPEGLRRLDRPQPRAVERRHDRAVGAGLLDGVRHPRRGDRAVAPLQRVQHGREQRGGTSGRAASCTTTCPGPATLKAARTDSERVAPPRTPTHPSGADAVRGSATTISEIPAARNAVDRPLDHRPPRDRHEGLRHGRTKALAAPRGHKQGYGPRRTGMGVCRGRTGAAPLRPDDRGGAAGLHRLNRRSRPRAARRCAERISSR